MMFNLFMEIQIKKRFRHWSLVKTTCSEVLLEILLYPDIKWKKYENNEDFKKACGKMADEDLKTCVEEAAFTYNETVLRWNFITMHELWTIRSRIPSIFHPCLNKCQHFFSLQFWQHVNLQGLVQKHIWQKLEK